LDPFPWSGLNQLLYSLVNYGFDRNMKLVFDALYFQVPIFLSLLVGHAAKKQRATRKKNSHLGWVEGKIL
jgi:hypothetical protein